jgi:phage terminase small subunit
MRPKSNEDTPLRPQEEQFCQNLMLGMNQTQAVRNANFTTSNPGVYANQLIRKPNVVKRLAELRVEAQREFEITREEVLEGLKSAIADAKLQADPTAQISGWREIGKMLGYYAPERKQIEISESEEAFHKRLESMDTEDLLKLVGDGITIDGDFEVVN